MAQQGAYGPPGAELQRLYDADAVDHYINQLQAHIEDLQRQLGEAVALAEDAQAKAVATAKTEALLGRALLSAQHAADQTIADAQHQAELVVAAARREADQLLADVRADAQRIVDEAHETVEAVFAALNAQRAPEAAPAPEPAPVVFPPPVAPPTAMWAPPPAARREPDPEEWGAPAAPPWDEPSEGTIVDLRPARPDPTVASDPRSGADWALSLGGTGTDGPLPAASPRSDDPPLPGEAAPTPRAAEGGRPVAADLLDRWRLARTGAVSAPDEFVSRRAQLSSLADGTYVSQLRGDAAVPPGHTAPAAEAWGDGLGDDGPRRWLRRRG